MIREIRCHIVGCGRVTFPANPDTARASGWYVSPTMTLCPRHALDGAERVLAAIDGTDRYGKHARMPEASDEWFWRNYGEWAYEDPTPRPTGCHRAEVAA